jgi:hypothetical protein
MISLANLPWQKDRQVIQAYQIENPRNIFHYITSQLTTDATTKSVKVVLHSQNCPLLKAEQDKCQPQ